MRVLYHASSSGRNRPTVYRQGGVDFCCAGMCRWWNVLLGFGAGDIPSTDREVNLLLPREQVGGTHVVELVPVRHCPFCGEPVRVTNAATALGGLAPFRKNTPTTTEDKP